MTRGEHGALPFEVAGEYAGDSKPKSVAFPRPADASTEIKDLKGLALRREFAEKLNLYVREKYDELWASVQEQPT